MQMLMPTGAKIYLRLDITDMRKSIHTLSILVADELKMDPCSGDLFIFRSRSGDKVKALYYEENCFTLWYRRLERGRFIFPKHKIGCIEMSMKHFEWLFSSDKYARIGEPCPEKYSDFY